MSQPANLEFSQTVIRKAKNYTFLIIINNLKTMFSRGLGQIRMLDS